MWDDDSNEVRPQAALPAPGCPSGPRLPFLPQAALPAPGCPSCHCCRHFHYQLLSVAAHPALLPPLLPPTDTATTAAGYYGSPQADANKVHALAPQPGDTANADFLGKVPPPTHPPPAAIAARSHPPGHPPACPPARLYMPTAARLVGSGKWQVDIKAKQLQQIHKEGRDKMSQFKISDWPVSDTW